MIGESTIRFVTIFSSIMLSLSAIQVDHDIPPELLHPKYDRIVLRPPSARALGHIVADWIDQSLPHDSAVLQKLKSIFYRDIVLHITTNISQTKFPTKKQLTEYIKQSVGTCYMRIDIPRCTELLLEYCLQELEDNADEYADKEENETINAAEMVHAIIRTLSIDNLEYLVATVIEHSEQVHTSHS